MPDASSLKRLYAIVLLCMIGYFSTAQTAAVRLEFRHTANGKPLVLRDSVYHNALGETYSVSRLKYYISHATLVDTKSRMEPEDYYLVDLAKDQYAFTLQAEPGTIRQIRFLVGVDSLANVSGAQTGALDPLNDMFWTWNSGYIFFKLEGESPQSGADLHRIEHHLGGFRNGQAIATWIQLDLPQAMKLQAGDQKTIVVNMNLDGYWDGPQPNSIQAMPLCMTPGPLTIQLASHFAQLFRIQTIE
jgi:hypothetical protein